MIRKAVVEDVAAVEEIYNRIHTEEEAGRMTVGWARNVYPTRKTAEEAVARGDLYVLEDDGEIAAAAIINQVQVPSYSSARWEYPARPEEVMVLHTLTVSPARTGRGYGKEFVAFYEELAAASGCRHLRMDTNARNAAARAMYRKLGYREADTVLCAFNGIEGVALICLEKRL